MSDKQDWPEGFVPEKRAMMLYVVGIVLGAAAGFAIATVLDSRRKPAEVRVSVPFEVPPVPCKHCEEEAAAVANASAELNGVKLQEVEDE